MRRDAMNKAGVLHERRLRAAQTEPAQSHDTTPHNAPDRRTRPEESWQVYGKALSHSSLHAGIKYLQLSWGQVDTAHQAAELQIVVDDQQTCGESTHHARFAVTPYS